VLFDLMADVLGVDAGRSDVGLTLSSIRWKDYDRFMQKYVKRIGDERLTKVPADLDLKPYRDEHDYDLVQRMLDSVKRHVAPAGVDPKQVRHQIEKHMPNLGKGPKKAAAKKGVKKTGARKPVVKKKTRTKK